MTHRTALLCGAVLAAAALASCLAVLAVTPGLLMDRLRQRLTAHSFPVNRTAPLNTFLHQREIGPPPDLALGPPDPTTLVSSAWIDLAQGPMRLVVPPTGPRPFGVVVLDGRGDRIGWAGAAIVGRAGAAIVVAGPDWRGPPPPGAALLRAGTPTAWIVARFAVEDEADVPAVHALQDGLRLTPEKR